MEIIGLDELTPKVRELEALNSKDGVSVLLDELNSEDNSGTLLLDIIAFGDELVEII